MKAILSLLGVFFLPLHASFAEEPQVFRLSAKMAREMNKTPRDQYARELGNPDGPFAHIGAIIGTSDELGSVELRKDAGTTYSYLKLHAPEGLVHLELFADAKGNGFTVVHQRAKEKAAETPAAEEAPEEDTRPEEHQALCKAAEHAAARGKTELLRALLQAGLSIDTPIDMETKRTALHCAVLYNKPGAVRMLLENGASPLVRDRYGDRPIDGAFEDGHEEICQLLALPAEKETLLEEISREAWETILQDEDLDDAVWFLSFNEKDPSREVLEYVRRFAKNARPASLAENVDDAKRLADKGDTWYRDKQTGEYGSTLEISLKKTAEDGYEFSVRRTTAPVMGGGGRRGNIIKKYGCWLTQDEKHWDE